MKRLILVTLTIFIAPCATPESRVDNNAGAYVERGNAYSGKGQYDQAIADYSKALEINPRYAMAYNNRGVACLFLGRSN